MNSIQHVDQLLELHGPAFLDAAYRTLLARAPDKVGERYYLRRLRTGYSRQSVIVQMCKSEEARARLIQLPGLERLIARQKRASHWLLGFFTRGGRMERQINQLECQLGGVAEQLAAISAQGLSPRPAPVEEPAAPKDEPADRSGLTPQALQILDRLTQHEGAR